MSEAGSDTGNYVVQDGECAIIFAADGEARLLVPEMPDESNVPETVLAVSAMYIRWVRDDEWRADLLEWFHEQARSS